MGLTNFPNKLERLSLAAQSGVCGWGLPVSSKPSKGWLLALPRTSGLELGELNRLFKYRLRYSTRNHDSIKYNRDTRLINDTNKNKCVSNINLFELGRHNNPHFLNS
jgi:hypothetical protein